MSMPSNWGRMKLAVVLDLSGSWGLTPFGASQPPKFVLTHMKKIVIISQKYIVDPLWFSHKSSTD